MLSNLAQRFRIEKNICAQPMKKRPTYQSRNNSMGLFDGGTSGTSRRGVARLDDDADARSK